LLKMEAIHKWVSRSPLMQVSNYLYHENSNNPIPEIPSEPLEDELKDLPIEIKHYICRFFEQEELRVLAQVSSTWNGICDDDEHWRSLFVEDKSKWNVFENPVCVTRLSIRELFSEMTVNISSQVSNITSQVSVITSQVSNILFNNGNNTTATLSNNTKFHNPKIWKTRYQRQFLENNAPIQKGSPYYPRMLQFTKKKAYRVSMLGDGLDTTAKDLLYAMMWNKSSMDLTITGLYPGVDGIGSGVGFSVEGSTLNIAALHRCNLDQGRAQWSSYFLGVDAVILVINSKTLPDADKSKLTGVLEFVLPHIPLMVLLCVEEDCDNCVRPSDLAQKLELEIRLNTKHRCWCVRTVFMDTLNGVSSGLQWLTRVL